MRGGVIAIAIGVLGVSAASWAVAPGLVGTSKPQAVAKETVPIPSNNGRLFLTGAQVQDAMRSGTLDRPVKSLLSVPSKLQYGDFVWNDTGVPSGPTWIRVDLGRQLISIFRASHEIGTAVIVYGGDNKQTPPGRLHILGKAKDHSSSIYDAKMPYTLRLTNDGVSIHASSVRWGAATHGCIGVPLGFAKHLFEATKVGDEVIVVPGRTAQSRKA